MLAPQLSYSFDSCSARAPAGSEAFARVSQPTTRASNATSLWPPMGADHSSESARHPDAPDDVAGVVVPGVDVDGARLIAQRRQLRHSRIGERDIDVEQLDECERAAQLPAAYIVADADA